MIKFALSNKYYKIYALWGMLGGYRQYKHYVTYHVKYPYSSYLHYSLYEQYYFIENILYICYGVALYAIPPFMFFAMRVEISNVKYYIRKFEDFMRNK